MSRGKLVCLVYESVRKAITPLSYVLSHARSRWSLEYTEPQRGREGRVMRYRSQDVSGISKCISHAERGLSSWRKARGTMDKGLSG